MSGPPHHGHPLNTDPRIVFLNMYGQRTLVYLCLSTILFSLSQLCDAGKILQVHTILFYQKDSSKIA